MPAQLGMRFAILIVLFTTPAWADDAAPLHRKCGTRPYAEPSLFFTPGPRRPTGDWRSRIAAGALFRPCGSDVQIRTGVTLQFSDNAAGFGFEGELVLPISRYLRGGVRASVEGTERPNQTPLTTAGLRLHMADLAFVGVDFYHFRTTSEQLTPITGVAFGVGVEGVPGAIASGLEVLGIGLLILALSGTNF